LLFLGTDIGSAVSKCVVLDEGADIVGKALALGGAGTEAPAGALAAALAEAGIGRAEIARAVSTGYGRNLDASADAVLSELSCHALGAAKLFPDVRTVIDIGGQDAKVLSVSKEGMLESFVMNDKCAAGTGRFLDEMSRVLNIPIGEMASVAAGSRQEVAISSTCVVFAETEVISRLAQGADRADVLAGVFRAIAARVGALAKRKGIVPQVVMSGGVAHNEGMRAALEAEVGLPVFVSPLCQYTGALGAALYAMREGT
jgi:predicted CoA-substrate-specific enzyme activase